MTQQQIAVQKTSTETTDCLDDAKAAMKALIEEYFVATELGYGEAERDKYHARHWEALKKVVGITDIFCSGCGVWHAPNAPHECFA